jgi:hypothetical protein
VAVVLVQAQTFVSRYTLVFDTPVSVVFLNIGTSNSSIYYRAGRNVSWRNVRGTGSSGTRRFLLSRATEPEGLLGRKCHDLLVQSINKPTRGIGKHR